MPFTTGPIVNQSSTGFSVSSITVAVLNNNPSFNTNIQIEVFSLAGGTLAPVLIGQDLFTLNPNSGLLKTYFVATVPIYEVQIDYYSGIDVSFSVFGVDSQGNFVTDTRVLTSEFSYIDRLKQ